MVSTQVMNPEDARKYMDENTIGLIVMFGSTYNGQFEDVVLADKIVGASAVFTHPTLHVFACQGTLVYRRVQHSHHAQPCDAAVHACRRGQQKEWLGHAHPCGRRQWCHGGALCLPRSADEVAPC